MRSAYRGGGHWGFAGRGVVPQGVTFGQVPLGRLSRRCWSSGQKERCVSKEPSRKVRTQ